MKLSQDQINQRTFHKHIFCVEVTAEKCMIVPLNIGHGDEDAGNCVCLMAVTNFQRNHKIFRTLYSLFLVVVMFCFADGSSRLYKNVHI